MWGLIQASRPLFLPGGFVLYGLGLALAGWSRGWQGGLRAALGDDDLGVALGAVVVGLVHVITHYVNDAEDVETDARTEHPTALTGGSRAIQRGLVTPQTLLRASLVLGLVVLAVAAFEVATGRLASAGLHLAILGLGYGYSGRPFRLGRRGLSEVVTALVMGVLVPLSGALAAGAEVTGALGVLLALLFLETALARLSTAYPDLEADRATGKLTLPALLGPRRSGVAVGGVTLATVATALAGLPALPAVPLQLVNAAAMASAGVAMLWVILQRSRRRLPPILVPALGTAAYGVSLTVLMAGFLLG